MSETPPPMSDEANTNELNFNNSASLATEIDLASADDINLNASPEPEVKKPAAAVALSDDLFFSAISEPSSESNATKSANNNDNDDMDEIFKSAATKEIKLDDEDLFSAQAQTTAPPASINVKPVISPSSPAPVAKQQEEATKFTSLAEKKPSLSTSNSMMYNIEEAADDEEADKFLEISLSDPVKVGDGMGSYMVYKLLTKTNIPVFKGREFGTSRRFSDFLNLYEKLKEKHLVAGRILPPAPEKDMIGMAKIKMSSKEETNPVDFIEKRKHALQRFLNRLAKHKTFRYDPDFRDFLEIADDLPKASNTSALSGAGMMKMFKNVTESVSKISLKMEETDQWFEEKSRQVENLYVQYKKMHTAVETMYGWRKDLAMSTKEFSKNIAILANSEEQLSLSRSLSHLSEIYEKVDQIYLEQSNSDYFIYSELVRDYVALFDNIREVFYQRIKTYNTWQRYEEQLRAKKESKAKLEASNKLDKIPTVAAEIRDLEIKVEKGKEDFEQISKTIKEEIKRFDFTRAKEFRTELTAYLKALLNNQETLVKIWEQYLPEVKAI